MTNYLDDLIDALPQGTRKPTDAHIRTMREIDDQVQATHTELADALKELKLCGRLTGWGFGGFQGDKYAVEYSHEELRGHHIEFTEDGKYTDEEGMREIHDLRMAILRKPKCSNEMLIEDGGLKDPVRAKSKIARRKQSPNFHTPEGSDVSRARLIVSGLKEMGDAYKNMQWVLEYHGLFEWRFVNYYMEPDMSKYNAAFGRLSSFWVNRKPGNMSEGMSTEIQLVTSRARSILDLNHEYDVRRSLSYPTPAHEQWVRNLFQKASVLDFVELLKEELELMEMGALEVSCGDMDNAQIMERIRSALSLVG